MSDNQFAVENPFTEEDTVEHLDMAELTYEDYEFERIRQLRRDYVLEQLQKTMVQGNVHHHTYSARGWGKTALTQEDVKKLQDKVSLTLKPGEVVVPASVMQSLQMSMSEFQKRLVGQMQAVNSNVEKLKETLETLETLPQSEAPQPPQVRVDPDASRKDILAAKQRRDKNWNKEQDKRDRRALQRQHANKNRGR